MGAYMDPAAVVRTPQMVSTRPRNAIAARPMGAYMARPMGAYMRNRASMG